MKCKHCNEEMAECVQPALLPTQQDIVLVTCQNDACQMNGFKAQVEKIARWYQSQGLDVEDEKKGGISHSAALRILVEEKVKEIEEKE